MSPFANYQEKCKKDEEEISCSSTIHSEVEEYIAPAPIPAATNPDHNYFDVPQKIANDKRQSRPSIDSSPETQDSGAVKEVMDSLVGVVTERFIDEETETQKKAKNGSKEFKIPVELIGEQSVYTTKKSPVIVAITEPVEETKENIEERAVKSIVLECEKMANPSPPDVIMEVPEEVIPLQDRAMELESEAAASLLVEEMRLDTGYCEFDPYCEMPKQEDQDSAYYECIEYVESSEAGALNVAMEGEAQNVAMEGEAQSVVMEGEAQSVVGDEEVEKVVDEELVVEETTQSRIVGEEGCAVIAETEIESVVSGVLDKVGEQEISSSIVGTVEKLADAESGPAAGDTEMEEVNCSMEVDEEKPSVTCEVNKLVVEPTSSCLSDSISAVSEMKMNDEVVIKPTAMEKCEGVKITSVVDNRGTLEDVSEDKVNRSEVSKSVPLEKKTEEKKKEKSINVKESQVIANGCSGNQKNVGKKVKESAPKVIKPVVPPTPKELKQSQAEIAAIIPFCMDSMRECLQRFVQHYKSLYRMAHYYCHSTKNKNLQWAREILLAATPPTKKYPAMPGLFADRKNTNFFNGIWRAPSNEIDRPGSFGAHMYRSVALLIEVLTQQKDYNMLVNLTQQLYRTPDLGKKYMRDTDRVFLVRSSYDSCVRILRGQLDSLLGEEPPPEESRLTCCLLEIYRACQQLLRAGIYTEETNELLEEAYTMYRIGEVDDHPSVLEQATKFCQLQLGKSYPVTITI